MLQYRYLLYNFYIAKCVDHTQNIEVSNANQFCMLYVHDPISSELVMQKYDKNLNTKRTKKIISASVSKSEKFNIHWQLTKTSTFVRFVNKARGFKSGF